MPVVSLDYIEVDDRGVAKLIGTRSKVRQVVMDVQNGMTPEQVHESYPHLSMAQIHAALAYYYDHKAAIDAEIEDGRRMDEEMRAKNPNRFIFPPTPRDSVSVPPQPLSVSSPGLHGQAWFQMIWPVCVQHGPTA